MRIIGNIIYFFVFIIMAFSAMFLGGVSGVAGTFYIMVDDGDLEANLTKVISLLVLSWLLIVMLRYRNKKIIKRNKLEMQEAEQEA